MSGVIASKKVLYPEKLIKYLQYQTSCKNDKQTIYEFSFHANELYKIRLGKISYRAIILILERMPNLPVLELYEIGGIVNID